MDAAGRVAAPGLRAPQLDLVAGTGRLFSVTGHPFTDPPLSRRSCGLPSTSGARAQMHSLSLWAGMTLVRRA